MRIRLRRREFIAALGGSAAAGQPGCGRAAANKSCRQAGRGHAVGMEPMDCCICDRLRELGWIEGRTVAVHCRWGDGRNDSAYSRKACGSKLCRPETSFI